MGQRRGRPGDHLGQLGVQRQTQPVAEDRLMQCGGAGCQRHRRGRVEHLTDLEFVEVGAARHLEILTYGEPMTSPLTDEESILVETVRLFVDREVKPTVRDVEHANTYPEAWIEQMKHLGIYGLAIPEEYGGNPVSMPCYVLITQELARGWMSLAGAMGGHTVVAKLLTLFGTEEQKQRYLPAMATGALRATMALTEPGGGSDLQNMTTTAVPAAAPDTLVINGAKTWISNARYSGLIALLAKPIRRPPRGTAGSRCCWWTTRLTD